MRRSLVSTEIQEKINIFRARIAKEHRVILDFRILHRIGDISEEDRITTERIIDVCASVWGITVLDLKGQRRFDNIVDARHCSRALVKENTKMGLKQICSFYEGTGRDSHGGYGINHATLLSSIREHGDLLATDSEYRKKVKKVIEILNLTTSQG